MSENDLWLEYSEHGMCGLCGNTGVLNTLRSARMAVDGRHVGVKAYCICPNGRALKGNKPTVQEWIWDGGDENHPILSEPIGKKLPDGKRLTLEDLEDKIK